MHNVKHEVRDGNLIITVGIGADHCNAAPPSSSGKTQLIGSTGKQVSVPAPNGWTIGFALNVMGKRA